MSLRYEVSKTLTATDMFLWWCKNKIRNKRHLKVLYSTTNSKETILISGNNEELDWLRKHVLILAEQINKLEIADMDNKYSFSSKTKELYSKKGDLFDANQRIAHLEKVDGATRTVIMSEGKFRDVLYRFNTTMRDRLVQDGDVINMKNYMGYLYIQKVQRNIAGYTSKSSRMPNWPESKKYKQELIDEGIQVKDVDHPDGKNWLVYFDDDYYLRYSWNKKRGACRVKNHNYYSFCPTNGTNGAKKQLTKANRDNGFLHKTYIDKNIYYPNLDKIK
jgi:hypothetical protein